jgi:hypothetical protein
MINPPFRSHALHPLCLAATAALLLLSACSGAPGKGEAAPCKTYCHSQEDGYQWAQRASLLDAKACAGYPAEFVAGCKQAVTDAKLSLNPREGF